VQIYEDLLSETRFLNEELTTPPELIYSGHHVEPKRLRIALQTQYEELKELSLTWILEHSSELELFESLILEAGYQVDLIKALIFSGNHQISLTWRAKPDTLKTLSQSLLPLNPNSGLAKGDTSGFALANDLDHDYQFTKLEQSEL